MNPYMKMGIIFLVTWLFIVFAELWWISITKK